MRARFQNSLNIVAIENRLTVDDNVITFNRNNLAGIFIYEIFHPLLCDLAHEEFWVLLLNQASRVIDKSRISRGGIDQTTADVRSILREALMQRATQIALIHNHPSGSPRPSTDDQRLTQLVQKGAQTMNIRLIDHVIVTDGVYYSFNDEGMI